MNITLHQLQIFLKVVEKRSVTKAAEELFLTQPAVSIQLKKLQEQFDIPIIEVRGRKVFITDFGKEIAQAGEKIVREFEEVRNITFSYKGLLAGKLNISVVSTGKYVMPYFLKGFLDLYPGVDLVMDVTNKTKVVESLEKNEVDFALVSILPDHLELQSVELMKNILYLVRKYEGGIESENITEILETVPLLYREEGSATRRAMEDFILKLNIPSRKSIELTSNEAVKQSIMAGLGYSVMPLIGIRNELQSNKIEIVPFEGLPITTHWNLVYLKNKDLSPISRSFLSYLQENKDKVIQSQFKWYDSFIVE